MTPFKCVEVCKSKNFFYAGLQVGLVIMSFTKSSYKTSERDNHI